jgi:AbiV family abortive infection protein
MDLDIKALIMPPGHFVMGPDERFQVTGKSEGQKLHIFKDSKTAEKVFSAYARCHENAVALLDEAEILQKARKYARAFALAIFAWEELGKSQIAADYYGGILTDLEYKSAFKDHRRKTAYLNRAGAIDGSQSLTVAFNPTIGHRLEDAKQAALYASADNDPSEEITEQNAQEAIKRVKGHLEYIRFAEALNGRIGSSGLFK